MRQFVSRTHLGGVLRPIALLLLTNLTLATALPAQSWDPGPLATPTPLPKDGLPADRKAFWQWLSDSIDTLSPDQVLSSRERVYFYISQFAKAKAGAFPPMADSVATRLFAAAAWMGIPGSDLVVAAVDPSFKRGESPPIPPGLSLSLHPPNFLLASDDQAWAVCFPYYFMTTPVGRQTPDNGVATEMAIISTLFAPDSGDYGSSQATILVAAGPIADSAAHVGLWLGQLGVHPDQGAGPADLGQWFAASDDNPVQRVAVVRQLPTRIVVIGYTGVRGTFEANRPHFLDFVRTLGTGQCAG
jgi:hypothetical protein